MAIPVGKPKSSAKNTEVKTTARVVMVNSQRPKPRLGIKTNHKEFPLLHFYSANPKEKRKALEPTMVTSAKKTPPSTNILKLLVAVSQKTPDNYPEAILQFFLHTDQIEN